MSGEPSHVFAMVCEGPSDQRTASELADRVLQAHCNDWLTSDVLDSIRRWRGTTSEEPYLPWTRVKDEAAKAGIKVHGFGYGGQSMKPDEATATKAIRVLSRIAKLDAILLIRDTDGRTERREGLEQARDASKLNVPIVLGIAHPKREAWVLSGFIPKDEEERQRHATIREKHGMNPDPKVVVENLFGGDYHRERSCWAETALDVLEKEGVNNGLADYLHDIRQRLAPMVGGRKPPRSSSP